MRACHTNGQGGDEAANVDMGPRLDLDDARAFKKGQTEELLYTKFKMVEQTPFWDVWGRRGGVAPAGVNMNASAFYR